MIDLDKRRFNKLLKGLSNKEFQLKKEVFKNAGKQLRRTMVKEMKAETPVKSGRLKRSVGFSARRLIRGNVIVYKTLFRRQKKNKKTGKLSKFGTGYASAVNHWKKSPHRLFVNKYFKRNKKRLEKQTINAVSDSFSQVFK